MKGVHLLTGPEALRELKQLAKEADRIEIAVAWATAEHPAHRALLKAADRVEQLVVGLHFHQTDPRAIRDWWTLKNSPLRVVLDTKGIFHPKLYLFFKGKRAWLMLGSANLTKAAFSRNTEAMLLLETSASDPVIADARAAIRAKHREVKISEAWLAKYTAAWRRKASLRRQLHESEPTSPEQHFYDLAIDFPAYFEVIWNAGEERALSGHHIHAGKWLAVLNHVQGFPGWPDLRALDGEQWKEVFGARQYPLDGADVDLRLFGWSFPIHLNKLLGSKHHAALLRGLSGLADDRPVTRARWRAFTTPYQKIFSATALTTATRLLAMIRPDRFAPANAGCIRGLSKATGINIGSLDDYWDAHQVIWSWPWARAPEPKRGKNKRRVWNARVALLDVLFYET